MAYLKKVSVCLNALLSTAYICCVLGRLVTFTGYVNNQITNHCLVILSYFKLAFSVFFVVVLVSNKSERDVIRQFSRTFVVFVYGER